MIAAAAGFWRRALALCLDYMCVMLALFVAAAMLFQVTGGRVQYADWPAVTQCKIGPPVHRDMAPPDFQPTFEAQCETSLLRIPVGRTMTLGTVSQEGPVRKSLRVTLAVDDAGHPIFILPLSVLALPMLFFMRWFADSRGGTPGRIATRIRLSTRSSQMLDGAGRAQLARRYGLFALPLIPNWLILSWGTLFPVIGLNHFSLWNTGIISSALLSLGAGIWAAIDVIRRRDAFYDRAAGTSVLRLQQQGGDLISPPAVS
jgi:hypothetical protein